MPSKQVQHKVMMKSILTLHLQTHRRDQLIEWIKGLLAVPFVLNSQPAAAYTSTEPTNHTATIASMARSAHSRYADIFRDVEDLITDHIYHQSHTPSGIKPRSKLSMLVPSISTFFTPLALEDAFNHEDALRSISSRRFVPPSFNDIRLILNTAQIMSLVRPRHPTRDTSSLTYGPSQLKLLTFDGDVTLYDDGASLTSPGADPIITRLLYFLSHDIRIGIVTAAGYTDPQAYFTRLSGLLLAIHSPSSPLTPTQKSNLIIMGGESNFLFVSSPPTTTTTTTGSQSYLQPIPRRQWILPEMHHWTEPAIQTLLDIAERAFEGCIRTLSLHAKVLRKERAVGIYAATQSEPLTREQLEETVLVVQQVVESSLLPQQSTDGGVPEVPEHAKIPFTVFNGGSDVFLDIGDKSLGVKACQAWFGGIGPEETLHVGDQFLSGGGNDFKARGACCCAWVASPGETVGVLDTIRALEEQEGRGG